MEKSEVDDNVSSGEHISHEIASSTSENKTNLHNPREAEVSNVSSERAHSAQQASIRSELSTGTGQPFKGKRKDPDSSVVMTGVGCWNQTTKMTDHNKLFKTDSLSSKESGEVVQLSSVDSTDPVFSQSYNEYLAEKKSYVAQSDESRIVSRVKESSATMKSDCKAANMQSSIHCKFDLNEEGMEGNGAECHQQVLHESEPISVVAKVGVPMGLPKKPLQFGGELGWKRSGNVSAFRSTSVKNPERGWIDLNVAATSTDEPSMDATSQQPEIISLDLNCQSEHVESHYKTGASSFNLNDNPMNEDTHFYEHTENRQLLRKSVAADTVTCPGGNVCQSSLDMTRPSYWVDLSSVRGFGHIQPRPFLVAAPTAEQLQMVVPSGVYIGKVANLPSTYYPPHLHNQHGATVIPQISGSVLAYANMRPASFPNGSIPLMDSGSRGGVSNAELLIPVRSGLFEAREKPVEQVPLSASQINYRQMASWN